MHELLAAAGSESRWAPIVSHTVTAEGIDLLLADEVPYLRVPKFFAPEWCVEVADRFLTRMETLPENHLPLGPCFAKMLVKPLDLFMHGRDLSPYFEHVPNEAPRVREAFRGGPDPLDAITALWEAAGWSRVPAIEHLAAEGKPYHPDLIWSLKDGDLQAAHVDTFQSDRVTSLSRFARRISFNIYLGVPDEGGGFAVYRRRKKKELVKGPGGRMFEAAGPEVPEDHKWSHEVEPVAKLLTGVPRADYELELGDLILFDACNYHQVRGCRGVRMASHGNLAVDPDTREFAFYI